MPTVSIFGPTNPEYYGVFSKSSYFIEYEIDCKYCYGTNQYIHCDNRICLTQITPQQVIDFLETIL